jgi:hypothetical protein
MHDDYPGTGLQKARMDGGKGHLESRLLSAVVLAKPPVLPGFFPLTCGHGGTVDALA